MNWKRTSVLVTGGAGFLGSHLVDKLIELGSIVTVIDDLSFGKRENVNERADFVELDIKNYGALKNVIHKVSPKVVYHFAANATTRESAMGWSDPVSDYQVNALGTLNVLRAMADAGLKSHVVYASSAAVYGEPEYIPIDEKHPTNPKSPYGVSKLAGGKYTLIYHKEYGIPVTILRIFNVYGPRQPRYVMFDLLKKLKRDPDKLEVIGTGEQIRNYCYVLDAVDAFILVVEKNAVGEIFNLAGGDVINIRGLVEKILGMLGLSGRTRVSYTGESWKGDIIRLVADTSKIKKHLGFEPKTPLDEGLLRLRGWFEESLGAI
ncbi:UDP-glucose 4-epimerase [subsurface metagenome]